MKNIKVSFVFTIILVFSGISSYAQSVHPGGWHTQEDLTTIRNKVRAGAEPWKTGWNAAKNEGPNANFRTRPSARITSNGAMHTAGFAAWVLTMKWVASGDKKFSDAAIRIINTWVRTVRDFDVYAPTLTVSTGAGAMAQAAEILAHGFNGEAGWRRQDVRAAQSWFKTVIYDKQTNTGIASSSNFGTSALGGNISMAVFIDDQRIYNYQRQAFLSGYNLVDGCNSVTDYITHASGQAWETGRDQSHVQGGIAHLTEAALTLWNQGDKYVYRANNRLLAGVEYHARYNLGFNDLPFDRNIPNRCNLYLLGDRTAISPEDRGEFSPVYYMSAKLFSKAGLNHPNTKAVLTSRGYSPEKNNFAHPGLGMFAFVSTSSGGNGGNSKLVHMRKRNASGFAIDGGNGGANGQNTYLYRSVTSNKNQQWNEINRGNGFYSYQKKGTNFCIDGGNGGANGQNVYLWTCGNNNRNQHWKKVNRGNGNFRLEKRNAPGFSLDGGRGGSNRQNLKLWASNNANQNQQWSFGNARKTSNFLERNTEIHTNPTTGILNIDINEVEAANVSIYNIVGQKISEQEIKVGNNTIALDNLDKGVYIIKINHEDETLVKKIIND